MKKKLRRNNKGFSLVELIVVVLIMAIIAVALAPQVMKWVGGSRKNTDVQIYDTLVSDVQVALTNEYVWGKLKDKSADQLYITWDADGAKITGDVDSALDNELKSVAGASWAANAKFNDSSNNSCRIDIINGKVKRTTPPQGDSNKEKANS